jgi:predicted DNA-binding transcriptional regulator YafY
MRTYRVSNILELTPTEEEFERTSGFDLADFWQEHLDQFDQVRFTGYAVLRVSAGLVARMHDVSFPQLVKAVAGAERAEDGSVTVTLPIESVPNAAATLSRFGDGLEVLEPPELRTELANLGRTLSALYS